MATSVTLPDYYALLQVRPDADTEVISAAYRQLMKKYHPDVAGNDPRQIAEHDRRSKELNQAFGVLRDPRRRKQYDEARFLRGLRRPPQGETVPRQPAAAPQAPPRSDPRPEAGPAPEPQRAQVSEPEPVILVADGRAPTYLAPFRLVAQLYYLLPGHYEWEPGRHAELLTVLALPLIGTLAFCLATGRLAPLIGHSLTSTLIVGLVPGLALLLMWQSLPRIALAVLPMLAVLTGVLDPILLQAHMPSWMAAGFMGCLSTFLAGRQFVFGVLPTIGVCWLITRIA